MAARWDACELAKLRRGMDVPGRTVKAITRQRQRLGIAGLQPFKDAIVTAIMRQGVTIDECAELYETTPRKICQLMGWE